MLTSGNWEIILSLLTGGTKCIRLDFILQIQLNSTRLKICKEKHSIQELPQYRDNMIKTNQVLADLSSFFFFFLFGTTGSSSTHFACKETSVCIAVVANSGLLKLQGTNSNSVGGQRIVHLIQPNCLQFSPQRILQCLIQKSCSSLFQMPLH